MVLDERRRQLEAARGGCAFVRLALLALVVALAGCAQPTQTTPTPPTTSTPATTSPTVPTAPTPSEWPAIRLEPYLDGFSQPLLMLDVPGAEGRRVVVEQGGLVKLVVDGEVAAEPFLDLTDATAAGGERGLLGLAFHPRFEENGFVYASYTDRAGDSVVARYHATVDAADPASEARVLFVDQPFSNHNGGHVAFGPDGMLYVGLGDGGSVGDPLGNGQDPDALLGSLLRLDVDAREPYGIPPDNPYANGGGAPEVWAKGLRNPWRFSFDRATGDLWIADVGQNQWEEVNYQPASSRGGENYGWNRFEGRERYLPVGETSSPATGPVAVYSHDEGCSVTGGFVYRGAAHPALVGTYVFGDYCSGRIWGVRPAGAEWEMRLLLESGLAISSFAEDAEGELYAIDHGGRIVRVADAR